MLPVVGGIFVDAFGTIPGALLTTLLITSGNVLVALSASFKSLYMMIFGRVLYGIGSGTVVIVQETILSQWFRGRSLAAVLALMLTVSRLVILLSTTNKHSPCFLTAFIPNRPRSVPRQPSSLLPIGLDGTVMDYG